MRRYSAEIKNFIKENVLGRTTKELVDLVNNKFNLGMTEPEMKSYKGTNKLKSGTLKGNKKGEPTKLFPEEIVTFIRENHKGVHIKDMVQMVNDKFGTAYTFYKIQALYKRKGFTTGLYTKFIKGHLPAKPIQKGVRTSPGTEFKDGHKPLNWRPIGSERVNGCGYIDIKIQDGKGYRDWKAKHVVIWEQHNGPLPKGHVLLFADQDKTNVDINNLILISKAEHVRLNKGKMLTNDPGLNKCSLNIVKIGEKIRNIGREQT